MSAAAYDDAEDVEDSDEEQEPSVTVPSADCWDDGEEVYDEDWSLMTWCTRCGHRPRPEHGFRCRLHSDTLNNAHSRPAAPSPPTDEEEMSASEWVDAMEAFGDAMALHKKAMDHWEPHWIVSPASATDCKPPADCYPLPCVRCGGHTAMLRGVPETAACEVSLEDLMRSTPWLDASYRSCRGNAERVNVAAGCIGVCGRCQLVVSIRVGEEGEPPT